MSAPPSYMRPCHLSIDALPLQWFLECRFISIFPPFRSPRFLCLNSKHHLSIYAQVADKTAAHIATLNELSSYIITIIFTQLEDIMNSQNVMLASERVWQNIVNDRNTVPLLDQI
jgi:hypothetical protein